MFALHHVKPRAFSTEIQSQGVQLPPPLEAPNLEKQSIWMRFMPLIMVLVMVGMMGMFFIMGTRAITSMMFTMPMMLMMMLMMLAMRGRAGGGGDLDEERETYDLEFRERRKEIYGQGRTVHDLRTWCFPHPADLISMVGGTEMWQARADTSIGRVVPAAAESDPNAMNLTSNPYLRARVGVGMMPLYPKLIDNPDVIPEQLDPATMVRYQRGMETLSVVANVPIDVNLGEYRGYAMTGGDPAARLALTRAMVMSLAFNHSPSDLTIGVVTDDPKQWEWMKWLPHIEDLSKVEKGVGARLLAWRSLDEFAVKYAAQIEERKNGAAPTHMVLIVDLADHIVSWPATMPDGLDSMTWIACRYGNELISGENSKIVLDDEGRVSTRLDEDASTSDGVTVTAAAAFAQRMHRWRPRGYGSGATEIVDDHIPDFFEVIGIGDIETHDIMATYRRNGYTDEIKIPFGYRRDGDELTPELSYLNFYEENRMGQGPHGAIAGRTGSGKSYFLRAIVLALVAMYGPDKVALILADFKGGATFLGMDGLPHVVASISNLEHAMELVDRLGDVIDGEVTRREEFITNQRECKDIFEYREKQKTRQNDPDWPPIPDLIVIIDEFGEFLKERSNYLELLTRVGRVGRSLGMHLLMCSQFVDKNVLGDLFEHLTFRYCLAVNSAQYSMAMIDSDAASHIQTGGKLKGKILRKFKSDSGPVEVAAFHHEAPYRRRKNLNQAQSVGDELITGDAVQPFTLFTDRAYSQQIVDGEVVATEEVTDTKMSDVLIDKVARLGLDRVLDLWKPSLREPMSIIDLDIVPETKGIKVRIGDLDVPKKSTRLAWNMDFGGATPHWVIAGSRGSGRTTLIETLVICGCIQHGPDRLMFMIADYGTGKLAEIKDAPSVAAYARPGDSDMVDRIIGAASHLIDIRQAEMADRETYTVDSYLASKAKDPVTDDQYGYVIVAIDGIGGFLGEEDRSVTAERLRTIVDRGASVGVHLVVTADSMATGLKGNIVHYSLDLPGGIQLPSTDYSGARMRPEVRMLLTEHIPSDQPGRSYDQITDCKARTVIPITDRIVEDKIEGGMKVFEVRDYGERISLLAQKLAERYGDGCVPRIEKAAADIDFERMWEGFAPLVDSERNPVHTIIPLGVRMDTLAIAPVPNMSQNLLVYGEKQSGKSNVLRSVMESVMRSFAPKDAVIIVVDLKRAMLGERERLFERGFVRRAAFKEIPAESGSTEKVRTRPPGYVTSREDLRETADYLATIMNQRRPTDDTDPADLVNRTFFTGPEIYVFIDDFAMLAEGFNSKTVFDEVRVDDRTVSSMLAEGIDLGVHFVVAGSNQFPEQMGSSGLLIGLRQMMLAPILQLAIPPSATSPIPGTFHLKGKRWRTGQGRLIVDADDHVLIQTAHLDSTAVARTAIDTV